MEFKRGTRYNSNRLYNNLAHTHRHMMNRCYEPNIKEYKYYGARGVYVAKEWHTLDGFLKDVDSLEGWDEEKFLKGEIQLDKDTKVFRNLIYSPDTCVWLDSKLNRQNQFTNQKLIEATHDSGEVKQFTNQTQFAKDNGLVQSNISRAVRNGTKTQGWSFKVLESNLVAQGEVKYLPKPYVQAYKDGKFIKEGKIPTHVARELGLDPRRVLECLSENHPRGGYKGYTFKYIYR